MDCDSVKAPTQWQRLFNVSGQFFRFVLIGIMNTGVDLLILNLAAWIFAITEGLSYALVKSLSFMGAVIVSYFANKHWTFNDHSKHQSGRKFSHFILISLVGMLINVLAATVVVTQLKGPLNDLLQF